MKIYLFRLELHAYCCRDNLPTILCYIVPEDSDCQGRRLKHYEARLHYLKELMIMQKYIISTKTALLLSLTRSWLPTQDNCSLPTIVFHDWFMALDIGYLAHLNGHGIIASRKTSNNGIKTGRWSRKRGQPLFERGLVEKWLIAFGILTPAAFIL